MNEGAQPQQPAKKGLGTGAWIAIGCAGLLVLISAAGVAWLGIKAVQKARGFAENPARAMAESAVKNNPDIKFISSDDETVTFETEDGDVVTMNFEKIKGGKFSASTTDGETSSFTLDGRGITGTTTGQDGEQIDFSLFGGAGDTSNVPDAVKYSGATGFTTTVASRGKGWWEGSIFYKAPSTMDEVVEWQGEALDDCEVTRTDVIGTRNASFTCGEDSVVLTFMGKDGALQVMANYKIRDE